MGAAGAPRPPSGKRSRHAKKKAENTLIKIRTLLDGHVRPAIGRRSSTGSATA
jgi:hypothetical protein